jgi:GGDEF domain-containing protein
VPYTLVIPIFLAHPVLFGLLAGALGTVWKDLTSQVDLSRASSGLTEAATGLYSPEYMLDQLRRALARVSRSGQTLSLLVFEVEGTREDAALRWAAGAIQSYIRESDVLGRVGQGRLLLIVHGDLPCALCLIQRMARSVLERTRLRLEAGVARWPEDGRLPSDLLHAADLVLKASWSVSHAMNCKGVASPSPSPHQASA